MIYDHGVNLLGKRSAQYYIKNQTIMERNAKIAVHYKSGTVVRYRAFPSKNREEIQELVNLLKDIEGTTRKIKFVTYSDGQKRYRVTPEPSKGEQ